MKVFRIKCMLRIIVGKDEGFLFYKLKKITK